MDRWNIWPRLTFYRNWKDEYGNQILDGTNNHCERAIGWWIKERNRSMRSYKQVQSALGISPDRLGWKPSGLWPAFSRFDGLVGLSFT
jgi:hypothetical protein